jgi:hypothetical protein
MAASKFRTTYYARFNFVTSLDMLDLASNVTKYSSQVWNINSSVDAARKLRVVPQAASVTVTRTSVTAVTTRRRARVSAFQCQCLPRKEEPEGIYNSVTSYVSLPPRDVDFLVISECQLSASDREY